MRYVSSGESHGRALTTIVTGVPAGIPVDTASIDADLARRQSGYGRGGRMAIESDRALILSGVRFGRTIGSPVTLTVANRDWDNWTDVMSPQANATTSARVTAPRPGHADLAGVQKTGSDDCRDILERASARETAARVAAGGIARALLRELGVTVASFVVSIGDVSIEMPADPSGVDPAAVGSSEVRCPDVDASARMMAAIDAARANGESLGGTFCVTASGLVPGLGTYAEAAERLDARLAAALISIPAIKGVDIGEGFAAAALPGSHVHDEIVHDEEHGYRRRTNRAGGLEGGMTNGEPVWLRAAMKPIPTLMRPLASVDLDTHEPVDASRQRSDVCAVPAAAVVAEAELAMVLADAYLRKFGSDCLSDITSALAAYKTRIAP
ncbi:MAG: chorismate synthase [Anaerosomatales bacterium]|nr:chorismate synthase [Anaerosomatales bacterium]MDT8433207.1 chorismate synthase [Anaerosomatales bacterium]